MTNIPLIVIAAVILLTQVALGCLVYAHFKLKRDHARLIEAVQRNTRDITGLCAAAVSIDEHIDTAEQHINTLWEKMTEVDLNSQNEHPYRGDIQKVRSGASIHELMQSSGISHDEAALLIRLHGVKAQG